MSKKSLTINAVRDGKKVAKSFGFVNPDVANSLVGGFAQMVNALSNDTFVNSQVVKVMDTTEEEQTTPTPTPAPAGKQEGIITLSESFIDLDRENSTTFSYNGDAQVNVAWYTVNNSANFSGATVSGNTITVDNVYCNYVVYAPATDNFTAAVATFTASFD